MFWAFGATFLGTSNFDQTIVLWLTSQTEKVAELKVLAEAEPIAEVPAAKSFPTT